MDKQTKTQTIDEIGDIALASLNLDLEDGKGLPNEVSKEHPEEGGEVKTSNKPSDLNEPEEEEEEVEEEAEEEKSEEQEEEEEEESEEEEEVIPKSKYEKMKARFERRLHAQTAKLKAEETKLKGSDRKEKLQNMSERELKALKRDVRKQFKVAEDADREEQLLDLEDEIDDIIRTAPQRFEKAQVDSYNEAVADILDDPLNDDIDFDKEGQSIKDIATNIYNKEPDLKELKQGQAMALKFAVEHYREIRKISKGKTKEADLKRKVTKLKRKTSLGTNKSSGKPKTSTNLNKKFKMAKRGGKDEKAEFLGDFLGEDALDAYIQ